MGLYTCKCNVCKENRVSQPNLGRVLLKVVNPNVDVNVDVDVTYVNFAFYLTSYLTFWRRFTSDSTCAYEHT